MELLPVAIGSFSLSFFYKQTNSASDIDLICNKNHIQHITSKSQKNEPGLAWIDNQRFDLTEALENTSDMIILEECNKAFQTGEFLVRKTIVSGINILIPPIEILYAIYKSHIHRVLPLTSSYLQNLHIWTKHMCKYTMIRESLNYKVYDEIIYGECRNEPKLHYLMRLIFIRRFDEVNQRVGDTSISLEKTEDEFFADNVKRYIDHDKLHEEVAVMYRSTPELIFKKYQTDPNSVNLDRETFMRADHKTRIQMLIEEITVLFLERKWIPELMECYKKDSIPYQGFSEELKKQELTDIIAHFVTNLCGQGHHWLRRYCLDHYNMLSNLDIYNLYEIEKLAMKVSEINHTSKSSNNPDAIINEIKKIQATGESNDYGHAASLKKILNSEKIDAVMIKTDIEVRISLSRLRINNGTVDYDKKEGDSSDSDENEYAYRAFTAEFSSLSVYLYELKLLLDDYDRIINIMNRFGIDILKTFILSYSDDDLVLCDKYTLVGIMYDFSTKDIQVFNISINEAGYDRHNNKFIPNKKDTCSSCDKEHTSLKYFGNIITFYQNNAYNISDMNIMYQGHYNTVYYKSSFCEYNEQRSVLYYISSYGQCPNYLKPLFEVISRDQSLWE